jgi:hypothetical protein
VCLDRRECAGRATPGLVERGFGAWLRCRLRSRVWLRNPSATRLRKGARTQDEASCRTPGTTADVAPRRGSITTGMIGTHIGLDDPPDRMLESVCGPRSSAQKLHSSKPWELRQRTIAFPPRFLLDTRPSVFLSSRRCKKPSVSSSFWFLAPFGPNPKQPTYAIGDAEGGSIPIDLRGGLRREVAGRVSFGPGSRVRAHLGDRPRSRGWDESAARDVDSATQANYSEWLRPKEAATARSLKTE